VLVWVWVLGLLAVAGCVAPGDAAVTAPAPTGAEAQECQRVTGGAPWHGVLRVTGGQVAVDAHDDYFEPSCLVVPRGAPVTLVLTDRGHVPHELTAPALGIDASLDAGQTGFVPLPPVQRPTRVACHLHEDEQMLLALVPDGDGGDV
jgi:hypothetical protein